jgi:hypothetical protein
MVTPASIIRILLNDRASQRSKEINHIARRTRDPARSEDNQKFSAKTDTSAAYLRMIDRFFSRTISRLVFPLHPTIITPLAHEPRQQSYE